MTKPQTTIKNIIRDAIFYQEDVNWPKNKSIPCLGENEGQFVTVEFHGQTRFTKCGWIIVTHPRLGTWQANWRGGYRVGAPQELILTALDQHVMAAELVTEAGSKELRRQERKQAGR